MDGHLRQKAARKLGSWPGGDTSAIPDLLCDEWSPAQVKAFRLMVNRSVSWADWNEELLALEVQELKECRGAVGIDGNDTVGKQGGSCGEDLFLGSCLEPS